MNFYTRRWVRPEDLNANGTLFGGSLLRWIDEEAAIYAIIQLGNERCVTAYMSEIHFVSSAWQGDLIELGLQAVKFGRTSLTLRCEVRNIFTRESILTVDKIVFVSLDADGNPMDHGYTETTYERDRIPQRFGPIPRKEPKPRRKDRDRAKALKEVERHQAAATKALESTATTDAGSQTAASSPDEAAQG